MIPNWTWNQYGRGFSTRTGKQESINWIKKNIPKDARILDVGFGCGIYARLLRHEGYKYIDGVDVYESGIRELKLDKYYNHIFISDVLDFYFDYYDLIILGDVLEHLSLDDGKRLLEGWIKQDKTSHILISVPYELKQQPTEENKHEEHLQDKINEEYMALYYPYLELLFSDEMDDLPGKRIAIYTYTKKCNER
ncbi:MAG: hypothetical protein A4E26_00034 [Methanobacterium sp. PtaU1.Bin097]|jgi:SAM-dependent methyltransferase|nr:MAG: hypothetical protein A4E26_00034 [Methanobacterium sp. PtaU1.Bin097]